MSELVFARQFLSALDSRPIKLSSDHISDPRQLPSQVAYTIPKYANAPAKRKRDDATDTSNSDAPPELSITLKNMKSPPHSLTLDSQSLSSSVFDLKQAYGSAFSLPVDKIKLLHGKKPIADSKTLKDVLGEEGSKKGEAEFGVMVMGGVVPVAAAAAAETEDAPVPVLAKGTQASGGGASLDDKFWGDLKGFLEQRLKNEAQAQALAVKFKRAAS